MGIGENMKHRMSACIRSRLCASGDEHCGFLLQRLFRGYFLARLGIKHVMKDGVVFRLFECRRILQYLLDVVV
jgi:hypothetical protein